MALPSKVSNEHCPRGDPVLTLTAPRKRRAAAPATPSVFLSYRHEDTAAWAAHVGGLLRVDLGIDNVFVDSESTVAPTDLERRVGHADMTLVLVGRQFTGAADSLAGDDDWVRREIRGALAARHDVVPVFFGDATLPGTLPADIASIGDLPSITVNRDDFESCYQSILTAVWYHLESRSDRLMLIGDDEAGVEQAIADFIASSPEIDWAEPRTRTSRATRGLQVVDVDGYSDYWPDVVALDRRVGSAVLEARLCGLAHPDKIVRVRSRR